MGYDTYVTCTVCNVAHWNLMGTMPTDGSYVCKDCIKKMRARIAELESQQTEGSWPGVYFNTSHGDIVEAAEYCAKLERTLASSGFAPCDIPACNCGGWHKRDGQVLREILQTCRSISQVQLFSDISEHIGLLRCLIDEYDAMNTTLEFIPDATPQYVGGEGFPEQDAQP